uniref:collagen alpha-1(I) chain-like n=1 Tax=Odobenus rosmarus divergens TaxID=9708 RepID=UPI00063C30F6|nr:PREDICTED: collagen alpha-1(I) chain-like [Odobenus rosmarus divergens]
MVPDVGDGELVEATGKREIGESLASRETGPQVVGDEGVCSGEGAVEPGNKKSYRWEGAGAANSCKDRSGGSIHHRTGEEEDTEEVRGAHCPPSPVCLSSRRRRLSKRTRHDRPWSARLRTQQPSFPKLVRHAASQAAALPRAPRALPSLPVRKKASTSESAAPPSSAAPSGGFMTEGGVRGQPGPAEPGAEGCWAPAGRRARGAAAAAADRADSRLRGRAAQAAGAAGLGQRTPSLPQAEARGGLGAPAAGSPMASFLSPAGKAPAKEAAEEGAGPPGECGAAGLAQGLHGRGPAHSALRWGRGAAAPAAVLCPTPHPGV